MSADYEKLAKKVSSQAFLDLNLLITACTHRSYLNENRQVAKEHNERLEFLGDAVLEMVVTEHLYKNYSQAEGILTNWRSALVKTESLAQAAHQLEISPYLRLSQGERAGNSRAHEQILANTVEAIIGALYLDQGYRQAQAFINQNILQSLGKIIDDGSWLDDKTKLQEFVQSQGDKTPVYRLIESSGPDHDKSFVVGVYVDNNLLGQGQGPSKQIAQKAAAEAALKKINLGPDFLKQMHPLDN